MITRTPNLGLVEIIFFQLEEIFEGKQIVFETEKFSTQVNFKRLKNETVDNLFGKPFNRFDNRRLYHRWSNRHLIILIERYFLGKISISLQGLFEQFAKFEKGWERCFAILIEQFPAIREYFSWIRVIIDESLQSCFAPIFKKIATKLLQKVLELA